MLLQRQRASPIGPIGGLSLSAALMRQKSVPSDYRPPSGFSPEIPFVLANGSSRSDHYQIARVAKSGYRSQLLLDLNFLIAFQVYWVLIAIGGMWDGDESRMPCRHNRLSHRMLIRRIRMAVVHHWSRSLNMCERLAPFLKAIRINTV